MSDEQLSESTRSALARLPQRRDYDGVAAVIAACVGLLALCVSGYTAYMQRQQVRAQVWTQLYFAGSDTATSLMVLNKGVGPARLQSLRLYVDGKPQTDWEKVFAALDIKLKAGMFQSTVAGTVIAANERLEYLKLETEDWQAFRKQRTRLKVRACYCSVLDECHVFDQRAETRERADTSVSACELSASEEFTE